MSGGGSSLMVRPAGDMTLADKQAITRSLLASGANIVEMNAVRKHLSGIKGGRLALAAHPARVATLAISDIPGDDPAAVASGPTVADPSTLTDVHDIIARYKIDLPPAASAILSANNETPKSLSAQNTVKVIAAPSLALSAAADAAAKAGLTPLILGDAIEGESREVGTVMAGIARSVRLNGRPAQAPAILLSGGETTVTIGKGQAGRGGRNTEFLLGFAIAMAGEPDVFALAGDSDGIDGTEDAAGAIVTPDTLARARAQRRNRRDKIVATVGPASGSPEMLEQLFLAGVDTFRLNFSHGTHEDHAKVHAAIRALELKVGRPIGILQDLQGPKIRVGTIKDGKITAAAGDQVRFVLSGSDGDGMSIPLPHPEIFDAVKPGDDLLIDDGRVRVRVSGVGPDFIDAKTITGGVISNRKGVNVPSAL